MTMEIQEMNVKGKEFAELVVWVTKSGKVLYYTEKITWNSDTEAAKARRQK